MTVFLRWLGGVCFIPAVLVTIALTGTAASAADRDAIVTPNADYPGFDYRDIADIDLKSCRSTCISDGACQAFTYNEKAQHCFLKSDFGELVQFNGATAGRIVTTSVPPETLKQQRSGELTFLPKRFLDEARKVETRVRNTGKAGDDGFLSLIQAGDFAFGKKNLQAATNAYAGAIARDPDSMDAWSRLAIASINWRADNYRKNQEIALRGTGAAVSAYLRAGTTRERAVALNVIGMSLERRSVWRPAIRAYRASLALRENDSVRKAYETAVAQHGFRILSHKVDSDSQNPRICVVFSDPLATGTDAPQFVSVEGVNNLAIEGKNNQICVDGVSHGRRYEIGVRAGLKSQDGETLEKSSDLTVYVRDRSPFVGFAGKSYVLPRGKGATIPVVSVNTDLVKATIHHVGDRALASTLRDRNFLQQLSQYSTERIGDRTGEKIWEGEIEVSKVLNENVTTAIPIEETVKTLKPGVYVITAKAALGRRDSWSPLATQWFIVTDLGLSAFNGNDGVHVFVRALSNAQAKGDVNVRLVAVNNEVLGTAKTDAGGYLRFEPGLARGTGGMAPRLLVAEGPGGDYAFLDLGKSAFDLTDRGVKGRAAPKPVDVFLTPERGVYRPGETVHLTALTRDTAATALTGLPLTLVVERPDGVEHRRVTLKAEGLGGYAYGLDLAGNAMRGSWRMSVYADPKAKPLSAVSVLVEDFEPERLAFDLKTVARQVDAAAPADVTVSARYLYGAPAAGLSMDGDLKVTPLKTSPAAFPGYTFGLADDPVRPLLEPLGDIGRTDDEGNARFSLELPDLPVSTRLFEARVTARLSDTNGRSIERTLSVPVRPDGPRIGIKPLFKGGSVDEGSTAGFDVIMIAADGAKIAGTGLAWTLEKVETSFQWYQENGRWNYERVTATRRVADGKVDIAADTPARISAPVKWGRYRLQVASSGDSPTATSVEFSAGWYSADASTETPDFLDISFDRPKYQVGETAKLRINPRFAGTALIAIVDTGLIETRTVEVPAEGTTVDLAVTEKWGAGAYVTATLYRPMDLEAKRMPGRALGLQWLEVDPAGRDLEIAMDLPDETRPRGPLSIPVSITNLAAGTEAYVTVAAVDAGILSLTGFKDPAPDDWYFGQRALGVEMRDLYGQLIDRTQGALGRIRSGGDGSAAGLKGPPPTQKLVAFYSGIVRVDADGKADIRFDMPDFNGTVRVMAMAWSKDGVGHAGKDLLVRDPVVVLASLPRFLTPRDQSRLFVEVSNVSGKAGDHELGVSVDDYVTIADSDAERTLSLEKDGRTTVAIPLTASEVGTSTISVDLTTPDGETFQKSLKLDVRYTDQPVIRRSIVTLAAGSGRVNIDTGLLDGFIAGTSSATVSISPAGRLDVPGLLLALDRYPYGCAEQLTSRALPLVYLDDVSKAAGLAGDKKVRERVDKAIAGVLAVQSSNGGFGLWSPGDGDLWLDAYITDFLTRAAQKGYTVPAAAKDTALDNLSNRLSYANDFERGGEGIAYSLYVLARNGRATIGDLRYFAEVKLGAFSTPLAKAQIGAALALYGDRQRSASAFKAAVASFEDNSDAQRSWRSDYGSHMRDQAAVLTLASETGQTEIDIAKLASRISDERDRNIHTSTQENAWLLLAANALYRNAANFALAVDGELTTEALFRRFDGASLGEKAVVVENRGDRDVEAIITATGIPQTLEPADSNGFAIERSYFTPKGEPVDVKTVGQNDRFVVMLKVTAVEDKAGRLLIVDPLPAGFEIENPNLTQSGKPANYAWLNVDQTAAHVEARADRFVAAMNRKRGESSELRIAYTVRAVSPGRFSHPAATVEDMYRADRRGRTAAGYVEVVGPLR